MKKKDSIEIAREENKALANTVGIQLVETMMRNYPEPTRAGTPKGDLIGFSQKKMRASLLMILYNPADGLTLGQIADIAGADPGVLRVWHTEEAFKEAAKRACHDVGEAIRATIDVLSTKGEIQSIKEMRAKDGPKKLTVLHVGDQKIFKILKSEKEIPSPFIKKFLASGEIEKEGVKVIEIDDLQEGLKNPHIMKGLRTPDERIDFWAKILPFFNPLVVEPIISGLKEKIDSHIFGYGSFAARLLFSANVKDEKSLKKWNSTPKMKELTKKVIETYIDVISDPEARKELGAERIRAEAEKFKEFLFRELNL